MVTIKLPEECIAFMDSIKEHCPGMSYTNIVNNVLRTYLPIYTEGIAALHNPRITFGETKTGMGVTLTTQTPDLDNSQVAAPKSKKGKKRRKSTKASPPTAPPDPNFDTLFD